MGLTNVIIPDNGGEFDKEIDQAPWYKQEINNPLPSTLSKLITRIF